MKYIFSPLPKTWIIDLDGTIVKHNGYKMDGEELLEGSFEFFQKLPESDFIIILTARSEQYKTETIEFLKKSKVRFDKIIFDIPPGERILINDNKPSNLQMAYAINKKRDEKLEIDFEIDERL